MLPFTITLSISAALAVQSHLVYAQDYPSKPIRIVTSPAGGSTDFNARIVAQGLRSALGQAVIVENRASTGLAAQIVVGATADGYTVLASANAFWIEPLMQEKPRYNPNDASPVTLISRTPNILVVSLPVPAKSVKELIALAKAKPGVLNYASSGAGTGSHLAGELFKSMAKVDIVNVFYKGGGAAGSALFANEVQVMFIPISTVWPYLKAGRLRALAVTSAESSSLIPELPTVAASGLPGYESIVATGILAPPKTPAAIVKRLNEEIVRVLNRSDVKAQVLNTGAEVAPMTPEQFASAMKAEMAIMGKLIKDAGIRVE